jgi:hypothetical protein
MAAEAVVAAAVAVAGVRLPEAARARRPLAQLSRRSSTTIGIWRSVRAW